MVLTGQPVRWLTDDVRLEAVGGDTGLAMDDVAAVTDRRGLVVIQAKGGLTLDRKATSPLGTAVEQAVDQFLGGVPDGDRARAVDPDRDRLMILGSGTSSRPIRALGPPLRITLVSMQVRLGSQGRPRSHYVAMVLVSVAR